MGKVTEWDCKRMVNQDLDQMDLQVSAMEYDSGSLCAFANVPADQQVRMVWRAVTANLAESVIASRDSALR